MVNKIAIGCFVQWYEAKMIGDYLRSLKNALDFLDDYEDDSSNVIIDLGIYSGQEFEKFDGTAQEHKNLIDSMTQQVKDIFDLTCKNVNIINYEGSYGIADYRREFNERYCEKADVLVWGESDMLVPKQMFKIIDSLHTQVKPNSPKYLLTFGINKMWDATWKPLEHPEFTDKPHVEGDTENWWSVRYCMSEDEMNTFNDRVQDLNVTVISPHKFNGCGLVISSEVIKSGVNIPKSVFFAGEDTGFMIMTNKVLGDIPQFHIQNMLLVHNREHPLKRNYVEGDVGTSLKEKRHSCEWYKIAHKMSEENLGNVFNAKYSSHDNWNAVWKELEKVKD